MKCTLTRKRYREDGIFGELTSEDGKHSFSTLEHAYKIIDETNPGSVEYAPKIPEGKYNIIMYDSPKHGMIVPLLDDPNDPVDQDRKLEMIS